MADCQFMALMGTGVVWESALGLSQMILNRILHSPDILVKRLATVDEAVVTTLESGKTS